MLKAHSCGAAHPCTAPDLRHRTVVHQPPNIQADGTADLIPSILTAKPWDPTGDFRLRLDTGLTALRTRETDIFALRVVARTRPAVLRRDRAVTAPLRRRPNPRLVTELRFDFVIVSAHPTPWGARSSSGEETAVRSLPNEHS